MILVNRLFNIPNEIVGVTGGIASGKTTFCKEKEAEGACVFYSDEIARSTWFTQATKNAFIANGYDSSLIGDRKRMRETAFKNPEFLQFLEKTISEQFEGAFLKEYVAKRAWEYDTIYYEDAMIRQRNMVDKFDYLIIFEITEEEQIKRVVARDDCTEEVARLIIEKQRM